MKKKTTESFRSNSISLAGTRRRPTRIGIVKDERFDDVLHIGRVLDLWIKNAMQDEFDVLPIIISPSRDPDIKRVAYARKLGLVEDDSYDFLWAFWDGTKRGLVLEEIVQSVKSDKRVIVYPVKR